jgi:hypothetical protein
MRSIEPGISKLLKWIGPTLTTSFPDEQKKDVDARHKAGHDGSDNG